MSFRLPSPLPSPPPSTLQQLLDRIGATSDDPQRSTLLQILAKGTPFDAAYFADVLPKIWELQGRIEDLFPSGRLERLPPGSTGSVSLCRERVACILSHMFLGTTKADELIAFEPHANLSLWRQCSPYIPLDPRKAYMTSLLHYFTRFLHSSSEEKKELVEFRRVCGGDVDGWKSGILRADLVELEQGGGIGEHPGMEVEMDFANKNVGFGATGTQEEILFGTSPELCLAPLILPTLRDDEVALFRGAWKVCDAVGYGDSVEMRPRSESADWSSRWILAIDALDFSDVPEDQREELLKTPKRYASLITEEAVLKRQLDPAAIERECQKLYLGFSALPPLPVATGKWGCGAFAGHPLLKGFLQACMASAAGVKLHFYRLSDDKLQQQLQAKLVSFNGRNVKEAIDSVVSELASTLP